MEKTGIISLWMTMLFIISCQNENKPDLSENSDLSFQHQVIDPNYRDNAWTKIIADLNQDGRADIIIGGQKGPLVWYRNPDWKKFIVIREGYQTVDGEAGDIDHDGDSDIVMGGLFWYENPGNLGATPDQEWTVHRVSEHSTHDVELADLNQDGRLDIITRNQSDFGTMKGNTIHLWFNQGSSEWTEEVLQCKHGEGLRVFDLDGDQDADIIAGGFWFENAEGWPLHEFADWHASANLDVGDFNGDGKTDIVLTPSELSGQYARISWFEQPVNVNQDTWTEHHLIEKMECVIHGVATADFNQDGMPDIAYSEMHQGIDPDEVVVLINQKNGAAWNKIILSEKGSHSIQAALIDTDGRPDILGANWSGEFQPIEIWTTKRTD